MAADGVSGDLAWWRAQRGAPATDKAALREVLARLRGWKAQHDAERAGQLGFLRMAWDAIFGDEDEKVTDAIREIEDALEGA